MSRIKEPSTWAGIAGSVAVMLREASKKEADVSEQ